MDRGERLRAYLVTLGVAAAMLSAPIRGEDDFPLSTFPMFSTRRPDWTWVARAYLETPDGASVSLSPNLVAGTSEPMQAVVSLRRANRRGVAPRLCRAIDRVELSLIGSFVGHVEPRRREERARCPVEVPE